MSNPERDRTEGEQFSRMHAAGMRVVTETALNGVHIATAEACDSLVRDILTAVLASRVPPHETEAEFVQAVGDESSEVHRIVQDLRSRPVLRDVDEAMLTYVVQETRHLSASRVPPSAGGEL